MSPRIKIVLVAAVITIIIVGILLFARGSKATALLSVSANDSTATITVFRIEPDPSQVDTNNAVGKFSAELPAGTYSITAANKYFSGQQVVKLSGGHPANIALKIAQPLPTEGVASLRAVNPVSDGTSLRYLNTTSGTLGEINSQNQIHQIGTVTSLVNVLWASPAFGLANDFAGGLYMIKNSNLAAVSLPFKADPTNQSYASASNMDIYVSDGSKVYRGGPGQDFKIIYKSSKTVSIKAAGIKSVLLQESDPINHSTDNSLLTVDHQGAVKKTDGEAYNASFSPDGDRVLLNGDERSAVLDSSLREIIRLPINNVTPPSWYDADTLIYAFQNKVWQFNIKTGSATQIADTGGAAVIQQTVASDGSYVYLITQNSTDGNNPAVKRVGLKNQAVSTPITILSLILPNTVSGCQMSFINFTAPTVAVQGPKASAAVCTAAAQKYLQTYHVPTAGLAVSFSAL